MFFFFLYWVSSSFKHSSHDNILTREEYTSLKYYGVSLTSKNFISKNQFSELNPDWLSLVDGNKKIHQISLPGTHETCARHGGYYYQCQELSLMDQLMSGVRFFDIRCRHINDVFMIHHGSVYQELGFGSGVRNVCIDFLKSHPNEFIYMCIKEEYTSTGNTKTFAETMLEYINGDIGDEQKNDISEYFYLATGTPTLNEVRGKIVLLRRFKNELPIDMGNEVFFQDDVTFTSYSTITARVQDQYVVSSLFDRSKKWSHVNSLLEEAKLRTDPNELFMNFASGYSSLCFPYSTAEYVTPLVGNYLKDTEPNAFVGVILFDFINLYFDNIIQLVIQRNY
ncbi:1-phosphatidylinositol phosphodiesterase [Tritrichomonas foetus]|uniref:1-phosphatidylinositol phosphodiesterase n=1 Tax=Tritrichomonas foetus TaxID=1144522 RepID=A0A1J4JQU3_9EUKA|nr:1-phosphatidylinositol phosphodiesterase [Tritrichomonas foetus]|eukprot:OHT01411.1 1-phosphatidylinositol phosphodiesterase [Tritrichomonas foetus]